MWFISEFISSVYLWQILSWNEINNSDVHWPLRFQYSTFTLTLWNLSLYCISISLLKLIQQFKSMTCFHQLSVYFSSVVKARGDKHHVKLLIVGDKLSQLSQQQNVFSSGKPVITSLSKHRADDAKHKVLTCEADGVPEPSFQWSVNSTSVSVRLCVCPFSSIKVIKAVWKW